MLVSGFKSLQNPVHATISVVRPRGRGHRACEYCGRRAQAVVGLLPLAGLCVWVVPCYALARYCLASASHDWLSLWHVLGTLSIHLPSHALGVCHYHHA
jgi:hypothetical protein